MSYNKKQVQRKQQQEEESLLGEAFWKITKFYRFERWHQAKLLEKSVNNNKPLKDMEDKLLIPNTQIPRLVTLQLVGIHKSLGIIYPSGCEGNKKAKQKWWWRKQSFLDEQTPIEFLFKRDSEIYQRINILRRSLDVIRNSH